MRRTFQALALAAVALSLVGAAPSRADDASCADPVSREAKAAARVDENHLPADIAIPHALMVGGRCLRFQSIAGSVKLDDDKGAAQAEVAFVAYLLDGADAAKRPVTFAINGGPGSGSAWLQLGALGPWRLPMQGLSPSTPPLLVANAETWLDFTDLVFIDPPGTGYSRLRGSQDEAKKALWSVDGDITALSAVIRRWLAANGRLVSPKFIAGESYGGFRGPLLAKKLTTDQGVGISGLVLISPVLDFDGFSAGPNNPFPFLTRLPSYAAVKREEKGTVSAADLADVEAYATGEFLSDWLKGPRDAEAVERRIRRVSELTGLDAAIVRRFGGDVGEWDYLSESKRAKGKGAAYYDATIDYFLPFPERSRDDALDVVLPGFVPAFASAIETLYRDKLGWKIEDHYEVLNESVNQAWNWGKRLSPPNATDALRQMLALDPRFRVLVSHGLTDVQTPYFATKLQLAQIPDYGKPGRLTLTVHPGGHMHYSRDDSRAALREEARKLIAGE